MEIANRELDSVVYLALHLAQRGLPTLFGERMVNEYVFRLGQGNPVIYFDQDQNIALNLSVLHSGGAVFNLSAEGQNLNSNPGVIDLFANASHSFTTMFVRGEAQRKAVADAFPESERSKVIATGHPSFDLLKKQFLPYIRCQELVRKYGEDYILINTQFGAFNHKMGFNDYLRLVSSLTEWEDLYGDAEYIASLHMLRNEQEKIAQRFVSLGRRLAAAFPERNVIVRPHPTEGLGYYHENLAGIANLHVKCDGPVLPWLASSGAVIHYSCTTGVEAFLLGKHVIRYDPFCTGGEQTMQAHIGLAATKEEEVIALVKGGGMCDEERRQQMDIIRPYAANCDSHAALAIAERAVQFSQGSNWVPKPLSLLETVRCWRKHFSKLLRMHQPGSNGRKVRYAYEKFPRLPLREVKWRMERLQMCEPSLPHATIEQLGLNVFLMRPEQEKRV